MTADSTFADLVRAEESEFAGPELLPVRLARATVNILGVDGAGISVLSNPGMRVPIGDSGVLAAAAERLQFTVGEGPCLTAHATGEPVYATAEFFQDRWPVLYELYTARTPFRAVVSFPLRRRLTGIGAMDLHLTDAGRVTATDWTDSMTVVDQIAAALGDPVDGPTGSAHDDPAWLDSPAARRREQVWLAIGMASVHLQLPAPDALAALRGLAYSRGQDVDDLASDLAHRRLPLTELTRQ